MTVPNLKVRVVRKPTLKVKVLTKFPSSVTAASPILIDRTGGNYAFSFALASLGVGTSIPHNWVNAISAGGVPLFSQPSFADISSNISPSQMDNGTSASSSTFWRGDGTWKTVTTGFFAADFGVKGDGGTYTTQMQSALDAVKAAGGGKLVLPGGVFSCDALTYSVSGAGILPGIDIRGQGAESTQIIFTGSNSFLFTQDSTTGFCGFLTLSDFKITSSGTNAGGISIHQAAYVLIEDMHILTTGSGIFNTSAGDPTSTFQANVRRVRFDNCARTAGTFGLDIFPSGTAVEISNWRIENCQFEACGVAGAAVTPPTSGAMRWRGLILEIINCGFTTNNNTALYIAKTGGAQGVTIDSCDFENTTSTVLPHIYCDTGIRSLRASNIQFLNNDTFKCQGGIWFDSTAGVQGNIVIDGVTAVRVTTGNNPYVAFKQLGTAGNWVAETNRLRNVNWQTYDGTGQTRFSGNWQFDAIPGECRAIISALNTITLIPTGYGATMPIKSVATGEWMPYQVPAAGIQNAAIGGLTANTFFNFYLKNNAAIGLPVVGAIIVSSAAPVLDNGYLVNSIDSTNLFIGTFKNDAGQNFQTTALGFSQFPPTGDVDYSSWTAYTPTVTAATGTLTTASATGRFKRMGKTVFVATTVTITTAGTGASYIQATLPAGFTAAAAAFMGTAQEINVSGHAGAAQVTSGATIIKGVDSAGVTFIVNGAIVNMSCTFELA